MTAIPRFRFALKPEEITEFLEDLGKIGKERINEIEEFEKNFAAFNQRKHGIFLSSARFGLYHTLKFLGLKKDDGVILPAWTHYSVPAMVVAAELTPLFADIETGSYNMSIRTIPEEYWNKAKVIIITHLYGCPAEVEEIIDKAGKKGIIVIEDCAQGLGAKINGEPTGKFGKASYFSLSITKNLTTLKGGMLCTDDDDLAEYLKKTRSTDLADTVSLKKVLNTCKLANMLLNPLFFSGAVYPGLLLSTMVGIDPIHEKFKEKAAIEKPGDIIPTPHPVQAILGKRQLEALESHNAARNSNGRLLLKRLRGKINAGLPVVNDKDYHIFMSFVMAVDDPWKVKKSLLARGIDSSPGYLKNCAMMDLFSKFKVKCSTAEQMSDKQIHIPVYPGLTEEQLEHIASGIIFSCPVK